MENHSANSESLREKVAPILLLTFVPALLYANTLGNAFQYDDSAFILKNTYVHSVSNIGHFFTSPRLISNIPLSGYRPLTMASFALNYSLGGENPEGYHLTNVLIHVANTLLVYAVSLCLMTAFGTRQRRVAAFAIALLFACHPVNTQPVNYISGRSTLLVGGFSLLSVLLYVLFSRAQASRFRIALVWVGSLLAYIMALLSKEEAVVLPALLGAYEICRFRFRLERRSITTICLSLLPYVIITAGFLALVVNVLGIVQDTPQSRSLAENLLTQAKAFFIYLRLLALPTKLSIDHVVPVSRSLADPAALTAVAGVAAILAGSVLLARTHPVVPFGVWWFFFSLAPTSTLVALKLIVNEQRLYLAAVGIMFMVGAGFATLFRRLTERKRLSARRCLIAAWLAVLILFGVLTVRRNMEWSTPHSLWASALAAYPASARANTELAYICIEEGRLHDALERAKKAVESAPDVAEPRIALATVYSRLGRNEAALEEARLAVNMNPRLATAQNILGTVYARLGRTGEAQAALERALELDPEYSEARQNLQLLRGKR